MRQPTAPGATGVVAGAVAVIMSSRPAPYRGPGGAYFPTQSRTCSYQ
jgi:hypothetical protein